MSLRRVLFIVSADFGEFVTANILSRGQPFERCLALPEAIARYAPPAGGDTAPYRDAAELARRVQDWRPELVVLSSGYLYAVNGIFGPQALERLVAECRAQGAAVATTDPWLRLRVLQPGTRFAIRSVRGGGVDRAQTERVLALQRRLEAALGELPHLLAVPVNAPGTHAAFNPAFGERVPEAAGNDDWLFVLSREDLALCAGADGARFFAALAARIEELLRRPQNRLRFIGPPALGAFLAQRFPAGERLAYLPVLDFAAFEAAVRAARIVVYWNVLSASLLYCLYYGVAPVFFGRGHQAQVCEGLYEHVLANVYLGKPPLMLDPEAPLNADAGRLIAEHGLGAWLAGLRAAYARLPAPAATMAALCSR